MDSSVKSVPMPPCRDSGGYSVQPAEGPPPGMNRPRIIRVAANGSSQKDQLFRRGSAMSGAPIISGICQLASPTKPGMAKPKIMTSACTVVIWLKKCGSTICSPGSHNSERITSDITPPRMAMVKANTRYRVPMSLWLVVNSQREMPDG